MNREIKFRAWIVKENKMVGVDTLSHNKGYGGALEIMVDNPKFNPNKTPWAGDNIPHDSYINHSLEVHKERNGGDDFILMQFTGLKDKNGVEIYEGDVLMYVGTNMSSMTVKFENGCFVGEGPFNTLPLIDYIKADDFQFIEVTGNIYSNPELLNP